ncbi:MAG TPA: hypothetical protein VM884_07935 [Flavisolibacter sp.]|jgi:hypothetical protein|nr:hypothetical protein [Flavisolibacter sp.]
MFSLISGLPPYVVGITAQGEITVKDSKTILLPALEKASAEMERPQSFIGDEKRFYKLCGRRLVAG